jgi:hypothetical protein
MQIESRLIEKIHNFGIETKLKCEKEIRAIDKQISIIK